MGLKWPNDPAEDTLAGPRYPNRESGEPRISAFKSIDSTDEGVLERARFRLFLAECLGLEKFECGKSITVDRSDAAVDGGPPYSDGTFLCREAK